MTAAVYLLSPNDRVEAFASKAQEFEYDSHKVLIGQVEDEVRSVVFLDESPRELKSAILNDKDIQPLLKSLNSRVGNMLRAARVSYEYLRVFVHFGGQSEDEITKFNKALNKVVSDIDAFRCYSISFGNGIPSSLFHDREFYPPHGEEFKEMCSFLQNSDSVSFEHLRALRLLLACVQPNMNSTYTMREIEGKLLALSNCKTINESLSQSERRLVLKNGGLKEIFSRMRYKWRECTWLSLPDHIGVNEYEILMAKLPFAKES